MNKVRSNFKRSIYRSGYYFCLVFFLGNCLTGSAQTQDYKLGPDDVVKISVYREEDLERFARVSLDGYISFPLLDRVKVEGLTVSELEKELTNGLKEYIKQPQVTVFITEYSTITVSGQVENPGAYQLKGGLTVMEAISLAGGFTKIAGRNDVKIMRMENGEKKMIRVKVGDIGNQGDISKDIPLKRGDVVFIPESLF